MVKLCTTILNNREDRKYMYHVTARFWRESWKKNHSKERYYVAGNKTCLGPCVKCPKVLLDYKVGFSGHIYIKYPSIRWDGNPSNRSRADKGGQTDAHDEANRRSSRLYESALSCTYYPQNSFMCFVGILMQTVNIFPMQQKMTNFYDRDWLSLLRGTSQTLNVIRVNRNL